jgi:hypothetical protein
VTDLERHIPMAERLDNDPGDAGRMARSFLAAMARLAEVEAERDELRDSMIAEWNAKRATLAKLARVEALCDEHDHAVVGHCWRAVEKIRAALRGPQAAECDAEDDWCLTHDRKHLRCYAAGGTVRPQPAEECPHPDWSFDRTICVGCDSMPDICVECGWHDCRTPGQRSGTARPAEDDDVCMKPHAGDPDPCDCGYPGERSADVDTEEDHDAR